MLKESQPIKLIDQIHSFQKEIQSEFRNKSEPYFSTFQNVNNQNIYQLRTKTDLVSTLYLVHEIFADEQNKKRDVICLYTVVTTAPYRNLGHASSLIKRSVHDFVALKKIKNPIIALHLDPKDAMMNFNYALYYKIGFETGSVCVNGPTSFKTKLDSIYKFKNVREAAKDVANTNSKGGYFAMFVEYENFMKMRKVNMEELIKEGEVLRKELIKNKK